MEINKKIAVHNNKERNVIQLSSCDFTKFFHQSQGNLLINAGTAEKRRACLREIIEYQQSKGFVPNNRLLVQRNNLNPVQLHEGRETMFVFSNDAELKRELINLNRLGAIGDLYIVDSSGRFYDFFAGMSKAKAVEFFTSFNRKINEGTTSSSIGKYAEGFLSVLSEHSPITLNAIRAMASNKDEHIINSSSNEMAKAVIRGSLPGGVEFRSALSSLSEAAEYLSTENCQTNFSLINAVDKGCVVLIDCPDSELDFYSSYFAVELKSLLNKKFTCIMDNSMLLSDDTFSSVMELMKKSSGITIVNSYENIVPFIKDENTAPLEGYNRSAILLQGNTPASDLQRVLDGYGRYNHMDVVKTKNTPPHVFFTIKQSKADAPIQEDKPRVLLQDEKNSEAVLSGGSSSDVYVVKRLIV